MVDPKLIVLAGMAAPVAYVFFKWEFSIWLLIGVVAYAYYTFDNKFISKEDVARKDVPRLGVQQAFASQQPGWDLNPDGTPVRKFQPPQRYVQKPPRR